MKIQMLGTGNAMATRCYNTCFILDTEEDFILVDAGGGNEIFHRMEQTNYTFMNLHHMILTHAHTDHILGTVWVVRMIATLIGQGKYEGEFHIYCHDETADTLKLFCERTLIKKMNDCIGKQILIECINHGEQKCFAGIEVIFLDMFSSKMKQMGFVVKKEVQIKPDPWKLVCLGDEPYNEKNEEYLKEADWLLCESFCLYADREIYKPYEKHHSTAVEAGELARTLGIKNLLLYHTEDDHMEDRKKLYTEEAKQNFSGNVFVPEDMEIIEIIQ